MKTNEEWNNLIEDHELAYFRADVCLSSLQSYSLDEKRRICADMETSTTKVDAALKADFERLPPQAQDMLLDMLCASGCMTPEWWRETLLGQVPDSPEDLIMQGAANGNPTKEETQR